MSVLNVNVQQRETSSPAPRRSRTHGETFTSSTPAVRRRTRRRVSVCNAQQVRGRSSTRSSHRSSSSRRHGCGITQQLANSNELAHLSRCHLVKPFHDAWYCTCSYCHMPWRTVPWYKEMKGDRVVQSESWLRSSEESLTFLLWRSLPEE